jgi:hypothetical protein
MVSWTGNEVQFLLTLVQEREALYDVANEDYTNRDIVWALWTDIARQLNKTRTYRSFGLILHSRLYENFVVNIPHVCFIRQPCRGPLTNTKSVMHIVR